MARLAAEGSSWTFPRHFAECVVVTASGTDNKNPDNVHPCLVRLDVDRYLGPSSRGRQPTRDGKTSSLGRMTTLEKGGDFHVSPTRGGIGPVHYACRSRVPGRPLTHDLPL